MRIVLVGFLMVGIFTGFTAQACTQDESINMLMKLNKVAQERFDEARANNTAVGRADGAFTAAIGLRQEIAQATGAYPNEADAGKRCEAYQQIADKHGIDLESVEATTVADLQASEASDCTVTETAEMLVEANTHYSKLYQAEAISADEFRAKALELSQAGQLLYTDPAEACRQVKVLLAKAKQAAGVE